MNDLVLVGVLTAAWCFFHSLFVSHGWRGLVRRHFPRYHVFSRLVYVVFSTASLGVLMLWIHTLPEVTLFAWTGWWAWIRVLGLAEAALLFWLGIRSYDNRSFLGITPVLAYFRNESVPETDFRTGGILDVIRHPWYTAFLILLVFCLPYTDVNLVWRLVFLVYILVGTQLEEKKLLRELGESYAAYRRRVPRFFPDPRTLGRRSPPRKGSGDPD